MTTDEPTQNPSPGYYPDANGVTRWWDGTQWGEVQQSPAAAAPMIIPAGY